MLSTQQFPALPAEEERYRQVLSASRVRRTSGRSPPHGGPPGYRGPGFWEGGWLRRSVIPGLRAGAARSGDTSGHSRPRGSSRARRTVCAAAAGLSGTVLGQAEEEPSPSCCSENGPVPQRQELGRVPRRGGLGDGRGQVTCRAQPATMGPSRSAHVSKLAGTRRGRPRSEAAGEPQPRSARCRRLRESRAAPSTRFSHQARKISGAAVPGRCSAAGRSGELFESDNRSGQDLQERSLGLTSIRA